MQIHLSRPDITQKDIEAVCRVLRSPNLSLGPMLSKFEQAFTEYTGRKYAVAVNSGTSALFLCLSALGIGPGDEVITTPFTFIASATCIMMTGAKPVFADIEPDTLNIDTEKMKDAITEKTRAILPVEVFGNPAGIDKVCDIAAAHNLLVVEDSCEALGSLIKGRMAGTFGNASTFAFYPNKQITTGEGGIILTDDENLADLCISLRNQGRAKNGGWLGHQRLGYNFRISDINCALGITQLSRIEEIKNKRKKIAKWYQQYLKGDHRIIVPQEPPACDMSWFVFVIRLAQDYNKDRRDSIIKAMRNDGIQTSNYFTPIHLQPFIAEQYHHKQGDFPVTESVSKRTIALPFYNNLTEDQVQTVCRILKKYLGKI